MRLRQLFEDKVDEVAIIFGRFNPPHKGHRAAWETASTKSAWYVGTNQSTIGPKDPLPFEVKVEAMQAIWPEVGTHILPETSWLTLASHVYKKHGAVRLIIVTDEEWVVPTVQEYNGKAGPHGEYNFPEIRLYHDSIEEAKAELRKSSATSLRDAVMKNNRQAFTDAAGVSSETPVMGKPFFDLVAEYLLPYADKLKAKADKAKKKEEPKKKETKPKKEKDDMKIKDLDTNLAEGYGRNPDTMSSSDYDRYQQSQMDYEKRDFKRREMEHELGDEEEYYRQTVARDRERDRGPWYIRIDGKILKSKGEVKVFDWKKGANNYALAILKNKPELTGKVMLTKSLEEQ